MLLRTPVRHFLTDPRSGNRQTRAAADGLTFFVYDINERFPDLVIRWLAHEELVGVVGLSALPLAVQSHLAVSVKREAAQSRCGPQKLHPPTTDTFGHSNRCAHHRPLSVRAEPNPFSSSHRSEERRVGKKCR